MGDAYLVAHISNTKHAIPISSLIIVPYTPAPVIIGNPTVRTYQILASCADCQRQPAPKL